MEGLQPVWAVKVIVLIIVTSILIRCVSATNHTVGGDSGWDINSDLLAWSSNITFHVGDSLVFKYLPQHDVLEVNQFDYTMCRTVNPISSHNDRNTLIQLTQPGRRYFICGRQRYCLMGLKLRIQVLQAQMSNNNNNDGTHSQPPPPDHGGNDGQTRDGDGGENDQNAPQNSPDPHDIPTPPPVGREEPPAGRAEPPEGQEESPVPKMVGGSDRGQSNCNCSGAEDVVRGGLANLWWVPLITTLIVLSASLHTEFGTAFNFIFYFCSISHLII